MYCHFITRASNDPLLSFSNVVTRDLKDNVGTLSD